VDIVLGYNKSFGIIISIGYKLNLSPIEIDINKSTYPELTQEYKNSFYIETLTIGLGFQIYL